VLVKMAFSPINPSDLSLLKGTFHALPNYPFVPGIEGCGTVVASGRGVLPKLRLGKNVSCTAPEQGNGTWAEYMVTNATRCIPFAKNATFEQAASGIVNPMTALGFMDLIKQGRHKAFAINAAASSLGKMILKLALLYNIPSIHIVRRPEQVKQLFDIGAEHVLCSAENDFKEKLQLLCVKLGATIFFDAVGGMQTTIFTEVSPSGSTIVLYANLSEEPFTVYPRQILQNDKVIRGFSLGSFTAGKSLFQKLHMLNEMKNMAGSALQSNVQKIYGMHDINAALTFYRENMSLGKVLIHLKE
jgi:NADPH:quinone reductase